MSSFRPRNKYAAQVRSPILRRIVSSPIGGLAVHWLFQGMLAMDPTERRFKLALDCGGMLIGMQVLKRFRPRMLAWILCLFGAHTLNLLVNGQIWVLLKHYGYARQSADSFTAYTHQLAQRLEQQPWLQRAVVYGSVARGEWTPGSDLDLRLIRRPGFWNGLWGCMFLVQERTRALLAGFPLDVLLLDTPAALARLRPDEIPIPLVERPS